MVSHTMKMGEELVGRAAHRSLAEEEHSSEGCRFRLKRQLPPQFDEMCNQLESCHGCKDKPNEQAELELSFFWPADRFGG